MFRGLDETWGYDAGAVSFDQVQPLYESGEQVGGLQHRRKHFAAQGGHAIMRRRSSALRAYLGVRSEFDDVEVEVRDFGIAQTGLVFTQHRFRQLRWIDHERPVDVNLGVNTGVWFGYAVRNRSDRQGDTFFVTATHSQGVPLGASRFLRGDVAWTSRVRGGRAENGTLRANLVFADHSVARRILVLRGRVVWGVRLDPEVQITLGADRGLRGYRVNEFVGDRSVLLTAEYRWFFIDDILGFVSVGAAGFVDAGYAWPRGVPTQWGDLRSNGGVALLFGQKQRTTANAGARIDLAYAFDPVPGQSRWVVSFGTTRTF